MLVWNLVNQRWNSLLDHIVSCWYKIPLGKVGKGTVIHRHVRLEGNALDCVEIGEQCVIDTYAVISCGRRVNTENGQIEPILKIGNYSVIGQFSHITAVNKVEIGDNFMQYNDSLTSIDLPKATHIGHCFLILNSKIKELNLPNVKSIGYEFLRENQSIKKIDMPNLIEVGDFFLSTNTELEELSLPNLKDVGSLFIVPLKTAAVVA